MALRDAKIDFFAALAKYNRKFARKEFPGVVDRASAQISFENRLVDWTS